MSGEAPILDRRRFALLRSPGDEAEDDSLAELVRAFAASSAATLEEVRQAIAAADWPSVAALTHRLKGASALFGATRLRDLCDALHRQARGAADEGELQRLLDQLRSELESACAAMQQELQQ